MPLHVVRLTLQGGSGDMATLADEEIRDGRFIIPEDDLALLFVRAQFAGGTGTADMLMYLDRQATKEVLKKTTLLFTSREVGTVKQVHIRVPLEEREAWSFMKGDELVLVWSNPDSPDMTWAVEIGLVRLDA